MKKYYYLYLFFASIFLIAGCNKQDLTPEQEKQIITEIKFRVDKAKSFAEKLVADSVFADAIGNGSFSYVSSGKQFNNESGAQFLKFLFNNRKSEKIEILKYKITVLDSKNAYYNSYCKATITDINNISSEIYFSITWIWTLTNEGWRALHVHESPVSKLNKLEKAAIELVVSSYSVELSSKSPNPENIESLLKAFLERHPNIFGAAFAFPDSAKDGQTSKAAFYLHRKVKGYSFVKISDHFDYTKSDWYKEPITKKRGFWTAPYFDKGGANLWMLTFSYPVNSKAGELMGVVTGDVLI